MKKTIAELIDELGIVNIKVFYLVEKIEQDRGSIEDAKKMTELTKYRSILKNEINKYFKEKKEVKV